MKAEFGEVISLTDFFLANGVDASETSQSHGGSIGCDSPFVRGLFRESFAIVGVLIGAGVPVFGVGSAKKIFHTERSRLH